MRRTLLTAGLILIGVLGVAAAALAAAAGETFDLQTFIDAQVKAGRTKIVIPPGKYRVPGLRDGHLVLQYLSDVEISGAGVEMICTETNRALALDHCHNVTISGLAIDYDPLPFTQGRIVALAPDKSWVDFEIIDGYPDTQLAERIEIFDPATRELRRETGGWNERIDSLGQRRYRAFKAARYRFDPRQDTEQLGDILVTANHSSAWAHGHAITLADCDGVKLADITLYAAEMFGFLESRCDGTTYLRCKIDRRPPETDLVSRVVPRLRSLNADAFHSVEAGRGPAIVGCTARYQGDDCVNIHGVYHLVTGVSDNQLRLVAINHLTIAPGDPVEFLPVSGSRPADAVAVSVLPDAPLNDVERQFIQGLRIHEGNRQAMLNGSSKCYRLTLDRPVELAMGSLVCSSNSVGNGFAVRDCDFGHNRSRGILIKASRGEVTGNTITAGWMAAVLVSPEFWWFESASSSDLRIERNRIVGCRRGAIEVVAPGGNGAPLAAGAHRDIRISDNAFVDCVWPNIRVTSTDNLVIQGNQLTPTDPSQFTPPLTDRWNWGGGKPTPLIVEQCGKVDAQRVGDGAGM